MRILYVEDEPSDAQLVERYVQLTAHQLVVASNVQDAQAAMKDTPDLLLVDVLLGDTRAGYGLVREWRRQGYARPIIAVTALATPYDIDQCYEAGFDEVLAKPYAINQLVDILDKYTV
jgi:DNA-binding response OmpR family regulator